MTDAMNQPNDARPAESKDSAISSIPRETGHGDFCFGRILKFDRMKDANWSYDSAMNVLEGTELENNSQFTPKYQFEKHGIEEWTEDELFANSNNTAFAELGGFERCVKTLYASSCPS